MVSKSNSEEPQDKEDIEPLIQDKDIEQRQENFPSPKNPLGADENQLRNILNKYIEVWLYSIQFSVLSGITFSFVNLNIHASGWGILGLPIIFAATCGAFSVIFSWTSLLSYLRLSLIPKFIIGKRTSTGNISPGIYLERSFSLMILALGLRLASSIFVAMLSFSSY